MKKIRLLILSIILISSNSCKNFLDANPTDFLSPVNYYDTEQQLNFALNGVYDILGDDALYGGDFISVYDGSDESFWAASSKTNGPHVYSYSVSDANILGTWQKLYKGIGRANLLLENINKPNMPDLNRARIKGEARFLRAYYYFLLVQNWGDVPLVTESTKSATGNELERTHQKEVYNWIIQEMTEAEPVVASAKTVGFGGRVSQSAVRGILARVCLYMTGNPVNDKSKLIEARDWAKKVIDDANAAHKLNDSYSQVFINYMQDKYDINESIWEVEFWGNRMDAYLEGGRGGSRNGIKTDNDEIGFSYGIVNAMSTLYLRYEEGDERRDWSIAPFRYSGTNQNIETYWDEAELYSRNCGKFRRVYETLLPKNKNYTPVNFPLLRFSDVLLMYAESESEINDGPTPGAVEAVNKIRRRGYGKNFRGETVKTIVLNNQGSGYSSAPIVSFSGGGSKTQATAVAVLSGDKVIAISITYGGSFYMSNPTISFSGGGGSGAEATAEITSIKEAELKSDQIDSYKSFLLTIQDERSRELCFEGLRRPDLIRWGIFVSTMNQLGNKVMSEAPEAYKYAARAGINVSRQHLLFPIPTSEMALNRSLIQNLGW